MLIRGQTTEQRIAEIANAFQKGVEGYSAGQRRFNEAQIEENKYQDQIALKKEELEQRRLERQRALEQQDYERERNREQDKRSAEAHAASMKEKERTLGEMLKPIEQRDSFKEKSMLAGIKAQAKPTADSKVIQKQMEKLGVGNAGLYNVKGAMDEALSILNDPSISEDQKIKTGQSLFKLLNSAEGSDAVGAEEAKRLGSYLEYNLGNFTQPGAFIGRDLKGFTEQVKNYSTLLGGRMQKNEEGLTALRNGQTLGSTVNQPVSTQQSGTSKAPWEKYKR